MVGEKEPGLGQTILIMIAQLFHLDRLGPVGTRHFVADSLNHFGRQPPFIGGQQHTLPQVQRRKLRVHRHVDDRTGPGNIVVFHPRPLWPEQHGDAPPGGNPGGGIGHRGGRGEHRLGQAARTGSGGIDERAVCHGGGGIWENLGVVQQPPCSAGHRHRAGIRPAISRIDQSQPVQPEIPHATRRSPDIFAHLRADQNKGGLRGGGCGHDAPPDTRRCGARQANLPFC